MFVILAPVILTGFLAILSCTAALSVLMPGIPVTGLVAILHLFPLTAL